MKVAEERSALAGALGRPVEIGVERIRQLARAARRVERVGRSIERRPVLAHEMLPRGLVAVRAGAGQREILQVQRLQVPLEHE